MTGFGRLRKPGAILLLLALLPVCSFIAERVTVGLSADRHAGVADERCSAKLADAQQGFTDLETELRARAMRAAADSGIAAYLAGARPDLAPLFDRLGTLSSDGEIGLEVYDRYGTCAAWAGRSGPEHRQEVLRTLSGRAVTGVERTPLFAELFCAMPVSSGSPTVGVVLARRILGVNYPFTNSILTRSGIDEELSGRLGTQVEFRFAGDQEPWGPGQRRTAPLYAIDSTVVGQVSVVCPDDETLLEETRERFRPIHLLVIVPLLFAGVLMLWRRSRSIAAPWGRLLLVTCLIWGTRLLVMVLGMTDALLPAWIQDRSVYATGGILGLAAGPGELVLSALAVLLNVLAAGRTIGDITPQPSHSRNSMIAWGILLVVLLAMMPAGLGLVTRSLVTDSTVNFSDPILLVPGEGYLLLTVGGLLFELAALLLGSWAYLGLLGPLGGRASASVWSGVVVLTAAIAEAAGTILAGGLVPRGAAALLFLFCGILGFSRSRRPSGRAGSGALILAAVLLAGFVLHLFIAPEAMEKDRRRLEAVAAEVLRPVDSWFRGVVTDALQVFSSSSVVEVLDQGNHEETRRIAFTVWAHTIACREGYASVFAVTDAAGQTISRFGIGGQSLRITDEDLPTVPGGTVAVREVGSGVGAIRMYAGSVPLNDATGNTLGYGKVAVAAARQTLFRGETPAILRSTSREGLETFHRQVAVEEYRDGVLVPSEANLLPLGSVLPQGIRERLEVSPLRGVWMRERVEDRDLETYYVRDEAERTHVVALSMERPGLQWHVAALLRILAGCSLLLAAVGMFFAVRFFLAGRRPIFRFRHRLLGAFLLLSVLPMVGVLFFAQRFAGERLVERTARELSDDTREIVSRVAPLLGATIDRRPSVDRDVERIATDRNTDFNLYLGDELLASSAPTLYEAGILDRRLSSEAYRAVVLGGYPFLMLTERIGEYRFAVGYRALMDSVGTVLAVVSVPTVFRQEDLEKEVARTTTFIAGLAIVVLLFVVVAATAIARTIAAPIQDLTEATAKVARGDLDAVVRQGSTGGELGVLVRSFERMTHDLKSSRDALIRYERELAWKEMAKQVAHEINNPLTPMKLLLQHLGKAYRDGAGDFGDLLDRVLRTVVGQIDQLGRIAAEFSHFARMPGRVVEPSSLKEIVGEVVNLYDKEPRVRFSISIEEPLPAVHVDRDELRRAMINVIRNGVQAMNDEGLIEIRAAASGAGIAVEIRDHGPGMTEDVRARAFEAGFTTKRGGSGIGLGLVKSTMDELGGTVTLVSSPGGGTTVTLWIPTGPSAGSGERANP